jgi:hypothetical protein
VKPVNQSIARGPRANCFAACIASVLECELAEVPQPTAAEGTDFDAWQGYLGRVNEFLATRNRILWPLGLRTVQGEILLPRGYALLGVVSPRTGGLHSVVTRDGEIVWDPATERKFEVGEWTDWHLFGVLDPAR